jgi:hypothetical protein
MHEMLDTVFGKCHGDNIGCLVVFCIQAWVHSVEDCKPSGRSSTNYKGENVDKVRQIINNDRRSTISEITGTLGLSYGTRQQVMRENVNVWRADIGTPLVPRLLADKQKQPGL